MPDQPKPPQVSSQSSGWLNEAPSGDVDLDTLFPNPELDAQRQVQAPSAAAAQAPAAEPAPFLRAAKSVYKTAEDAIRGTDEKDRVIDQLRSKLQGYEGVDPLKKPAQSQADAPVSYWEKPEAVFDDLVDAAQKGDKRRYAKILGDYQDQRLAPYVPLITEAARERAIRVSEREIQGFSGFYGSTAYTAALESIPILKQAIENAEHVPELTAQLPQLYKTAYLVAQGANVNELVRNAAANPAATQNQRPTLTASTPTPPAPAQGVAGRPAADPRNLESKEGRQGILEYGKQRNFGDVRWDDVGL